jgi:hypothetical protein
MDTNGHEYTFKKFQNISGMTGYLVSRVILSDISAFYCERSEQICVYTRPSAVSLHEAYFIH